MPKVKPIEDNEKENACVNAGYFTELALYEILGLPEDVLQSLLACDEDGV